MLYYEPSVIYLNVCICIILLLLVVPTLLNTKEEFKVRFAFALVFLTVIINCTTNVIVFLYHNYTLLPIVFFLFFIPLLFGPAVFYYVKGLLGNSVHKSIVYTFIPGAISFVYGIYLTRENSEVKEKILQVIIDGNHYLFNALNLITLFYILLYSVKSWVFLKKHYTNTKDTFYQQSRLKKAWAKEFVLYIFGHVFVFLFIHSAVVAKLIPISAMDLELVWMPVFMLFVYLLIAIRSTMMYKEFEHQFVLSKIESDRKIQEQRMEIARDLHDSLGAQLTLINTLTDSIKREVPSDSKLSNNIDRLSYFSENSITELKNALWVLHSNDITLADFHFKLHNFFQRIQDTTTSIQVFYQFDIKKNLTINSKQASNLLRIIQEFVNNSFKHAQNDKLWITIEQFEMESLHIEMCDNGKGFNIEEIKSHSYGINNLRHRVHSMNGTISINSSKEQGTTCLITLRLTS